MDVILSEVDLYDASGIDILGFLQANLRFSEIPVILLTVRIDPNQVRSVIRAGAKDVLLLPVTDQMLLDRTRDVMTAMRRMVLITDPGLIFQQILTRVINRCGHLAEVAQTGAEVLKVSRTRKVDLVLLEPLSLGSDPLELVASLKDIQPHIRVAFIVDKDNSIDRDFLLASGVDGVITRPFLSCDVEFQIREILSGS
ncbi:MAG: hypothetical protein DRP45_05175 [Candidatus Zixiibacteriota bacterium]|nr:MAG: hypothetical protein DRP45_05175 [candidate division Zixibacteria bacterium]